MSKFSRVYHLFFGLLDGIALVAAFLLSLNVLGIFFSYFTVLSNILITSLFLYLAVNNPKKISSSLAWIYGAATLYMSITGVVYWTILVNQRSLTIDPWINMILHGITPLVAFLGWIFFSPKLKVSYKNAWEWLILPLLFVFYTLIRGSFVNWYPYPFLNPIITGGYLRLAGNVVLILLGAFIAGVVLIWIANKTNQKKF